jgi:hypothetical protein
MSALVDAASRGDIAMVRRLLKEGASLGESDVNGRTAMHMALFRRHTLVVKCLIKEGGADIEANTVLEAGNLEYTVLEETVMWGKYALAQWLIEEGARIRPAGIWYMLKRSLNLERADAAELSSLLKVLLLLPMSPDQDHFLPVFVANLSPQHAELCTRGRQLRDRLPAYLEQQEASVRTHCPLPAVLQAIVTAYGRAHTRGPVERRAAVTVT